MSQIDSCVQTGLTAVLSFLFTVEFSDLCRKKSPNPIFLLISHNEMEDSNMKMVGSTHPGHCSGKMSNYFTSPALSAQKSPRDFQCCYLEQRAAFCMNHTRLLFLVYSLLIEGLLAHTFKSSTEVCTQLNIPSELDELEFFPDIPFFYKNAQHLSRQNFVLCLIIGDLILSMI